MRNEYPAEIDLPSTLRSPRSLHSSQTPLQCLTSIAYLTPPSERRRALPGYQATAQPARFTGLTPQCCWNVFLQLLFNRNEVQSFKGYIRGNLHRTSAPVVYFLRHHRLNEWRCFVASLVTGSGAACWQTCRCTDLSGRIGRKTSVTKPKNFTMSWIILFAPLNFDFNRDVRAAPRSFLPWCIGPPGTAGAGRRTEATVVKVSGSRPDGVLQSVESDVDGGDGGDSRPAGCIREPVQRRTLSFCTSTRQVATVSDFLAGRPLKPFTALPPPPPAAAARDAAAGHRLQACAVACNGDPDAAVQRDFLYRDAQSQRDQPGVFSLPTVALGNVFRYRLLFIAVEQGNASGQSYPRSPIFHQTPGHYRTRGHHTTHRRAPDGGEFVAHYADRVRKQHAGRHAA
ncbi:hypothetical protein GWK47_007820 [Chionoecetes opilio]|uniref:Uncharacterized protein n=1 Tax=Chionoecetes opilio TaxID=41210 RepID=A0A8J4Y1E6_CHIOP|nr:hypothetical protein GWK47_007820 [Chionoecetes opilio]